MRIIVGITGASGAILGVRLVEELLKRRRSSSDPGEAEPVDVFPVITQAAWRMIDIEMGRRPDFSGLRVFAQDDFAAPLASSSFVCDAMAVAPCSMKTLAGIAHGYADSLVVRAADTMLRTGKCLVVVPRETPLSLASLRNMATLKQAGAIVLPPVLAFYPRPRTLEDVVDFIVGKVLDNLGIANDLYRRWGDDGPQGAGHDPVHHGGTNQQP